MNRHHAAYYLTGEWERTGVTSADRDFLANRWPIITIGGHNVIRTGHRRSLIALIEGRPVTARTLLLTSPGGGSISPRIKDGQAAMIRQRLVNARTQDWLDGRDLQIRTNAEEPRSYYPGWVHDHCGFGASVNPIWAFDQGAMSPKAVPLLKKSAPKGSFKISRPTG